MKAFLVAFGVGRRACGRDGRAGVPPFLVELQLRRPDVHDHDDAGRRAGLCERRAVRGLSVGRRLLELR